MGRGAVEFLCGPPEYHAEIFVSVQGSDGATDRLDLGGLMASSFVRDWVTENRLQASGKDRLRAEVEWFVSLLQFLRGCDEFDSLLPQ